jgi:hypothetical protein
VKVGVVLPAGRGWLMSSRRLTVDSYSAFRSCMTGRAARQELPSR